MKLLQGDYIVVEFSQKEMKGIVLRQKVDITETFTAETLAAQLGKALNVCEADAALDDYNNTEHLSFDQFRYYLFQEVFSSLPDEMDVGQQHELELKVDESCWSLCRDHYNQSEATKAIFDDDCQFQLFRIFGMLSDLVENEKGLAEAIMAAAEVENVVFQFMLNVGKADEWDPEEFDNIVGVVPVFRFAVFVSVLESKYASDVDQGAIREAIRDLHDLFLKDVVKKGVLGKRMELLPAFREHFFVLQPHQLSFYSSAKQRDLRGRILLDADTKVEALPDQNRPPRLGKSPIRAPGAKSHSRFRLSVNKNTNKTSANNSNNNSPSSVMNVDFQASDHRSRLQWLASLKTCVSHLQRGDFVRLQRVQLLKRRASRHEEKMRETDQMSIMGAELEAAKMARAHAEARADTMEQQRVLEEQRMRELENIQKQLEALLEEERQAKKDEEIVRTLQARILNEEWARRETLERLQEEQRSMLESERRKREQFEKEQAEKESQLKEAQQRVEEMERERRKLDRQLYMAQEKTKKANLGQEALEARIRVKEHEKQSEKELSRVTSLNPSSSIYLRNGSTYMPMRSASMRETSYSRSIRRSRAKANNNSNNVGDGNSVSGDNIVEENDENNKSSGDKKEENEEHNKTENKEEKDEKSANNDDEIENEDNESNKEEQTDKKENEENDHI